ncbi:hypothetical protein [Microcoleus sp. OTE_8_concoct_300]|uniref:hypothetical protein n=1 Tax=Microcoleus sp. OTE_8_concoct_300 TaxID=2964710 RepID=UPI00403F674A
MEIIKKIVYAIGCILLVCLVLAAAWSIFSQAFAGPAEFIGNLVQTNPVIGIPLLILGVIVGLGLLVVFFVAIAGS